MFGFSKKKGNYAYIATRAKAKKSLKLREEDYNKMLQMSVAEISRYISDSGYSKEMMELGDKLVGMDLVERATYLHMADTFKSLLNGSQGELHTLLSAYLQKWDNWNLKVILRGKSYGLSADEIRDDLVPAGNLSAEKLEKMIALDSSEEILAVFSKEESLSIPNDVLADFKANGNLGKVEDYLDKMQYTRLIKAIDGDSIASRMFLDYVREDIDIKNLETILKLKVEGITGDAVMEYVIPGGKQINSKFAKQLADAATLKETYADLQTLEIYDYIKDLVDNDNLTVRDLIKHTKKFQIREAKRFSSQYPLSILPVVDCMISMEVEASNIRTVARGIESGLDKQIVKELLVI